MRKPKTVTPVQGYHFYASNALYWFVGKTRAEALSKVLKASKSYFRPNDDGGIWVWSVRVELPIDAKYEIRNYAPHDVPMEADSVLDGSFKIVGKNVVKLS